MATDAEICPVEVADIDLIDELPQTNQTASTLQEYQERATITAVNNSLWTLENGLLKYQGRLAVAADNDLQT
jgi:hypothetical protein